MSQLIVVGYPNIDQAQRVLGALLRLETEHLIDLEDAAIVTRSEKGKIRLHQTQDLTGAGLARGSMVGLLLGLLVLNPLLGVVAGAASGALVGALSDIGISDDFMRQIGEQLTPGSSALFILVRRATPDRVVEELAPHGGTLLRTSLSRQDEAELRALIEVAQQRQVALQTRSMAVVGDTTAASSSGAHHDVV
jgi:uncharacterized membrane protein